MTPSFYTVEQEENIHIRKQAHRWQRSGLISAEQLLIIQDVTDPHLQQTNLFFRLLFFVFTLLCAGAIIGLLVWLMKGAGMKTLAALVLLFGGACFILAIKLIKNRQLYRYGVEEALLMVGMICFVVSLLIFADDFGFNHQAVAIAGCLLFASIAGLIFFRAGYLYAAFIGVVAACFVPFQLSVSPVTERLLLLLILGGLFVFSLRADKPENEDFLKDRCAWVQTGLVTAIYLTVNLQMMGLSILVGAPFGNNRSIDLYLQLFPPYLYWSSYLLTFIIPAAVIFWGIRRRLRPVLIAGLLMACVTAATNKSYLQMVRYAWDPIILGFVLITLSLLITRWLNRGERESRRGWTAKEILKPESTGVNLADVAAALTPGAIDAPKPEAPPEQFFEGGSSGGGGTSRNF